jgi:hypothetical protein
MYLKRKWAWIGGASISAGSALFCYLVDRRRLCLIVS